MTSSWLSAPASSLSACLKDWKTSKTTLERLIRAARPCASGSRGASSAPASRQKGHRRWLAALDLLDDAAEAVEAKVVFLQSEIRTKARETKGPKTSKHRRKTDKSGVLAPRWPRCRSWPSLTLDITTCSRSFRPWAARQHLVQGDLLAPTLGLD